MEILDIKTNKKDEVIDITDDINDYLSIINSPNGLCSISVLHTTCCLSTMDLDPGTDLDFLETLRSLLPDKKYRHPHDPSHAPDHLLASIIGTSLTLPFKENELFLGMWERVVLVELNGPKDRKVVVYTIGG